MLAGSSRRTICSPKSKAIASTHSGRGGCPGGWFELQKGGGVEKGVPSKSTTPKFRSSLDLAPVTALDLVHEANMPEMYVERCRQCCSRTQARHDPGTRLARQSRTRADDAQRQSTVLSEAAPLISMKQEPLPCCLSEHLLLSSWETRPPVSNACLTIQLGRECGSGRPPGTPLPRDVCHQGALWSPSPYDFSIHRAERSPAPQRGRCSVESFPRR